MEVGKKKAEYKYSISYLGKTLNTNISEPISDEEYEQIKKEYYEKPSFDLVKKQFRTISKGGTQVNHIVNYYMKDLMAKVLVHYNKWTIEEVLKCKPLIEFFVGKSSKNKKVFPETYSLCKKIETAFRLCGKGVCSKPANFPMKSIDGLLEQFNVNNKYYDFSCGWGVRLLSSLKHKVEYYGTDPNFLLCERLNQIANDYKEITQDDIKVSIYPQGSEILIPELIGQIGFSFSSPPYYNLEDYKIGEQSYKENTSYDSWKESYLKKTISNIYQYLVNGGYFAININNFDKYDLVSDVYEIAIKENFVFYDIVDLKNITRCSGYRNAEENKICWHDNNEKILIFKKVV